MALGKFLNSYGPYFSVLQNEGNKGMLGYLSEIIHPKCLTVDLQHIGTHITVSVSVFFFINSFLIVKLTHEQHNDFLDRTTKMVK